MDILCKSWSSFKSPNLRIEQTVCFDLPDTTDYQNNTIQDGHEDEDDLLEVHLIALLASETEVDEVSGQTSLCDILYHLITNHD